MCSREGKHALGQGRAPLCAQGCVFKQRYGFGVVGQALAQQFKTAKHSHQHIAKIVGDAACELADRLQLLRL